MRFKRVYIEITNKCNLSCSFCLNDNRKKQEMNLIQFEEILSKIDKYTDYIYLHVKGEPLIHSNLDQILTLTNKYNKYVNITTNGVFFKEKVKILKKYTNIRQINISLHSENKKDNYIEDILESVDELNDIFIVYRFWTLKDNKLDEKMLIYLKKIKNKYNLSEKKYKMILYDSNIKIKDNIYIDKDKEFTWPDINNKYFKEEGFCYGLKNQIGILVDGTVIICCLDSFGLTKIGNIFEDSLENILRGEIVNKILKGFNDRKVYLDMCKHCSYKEKFNKFIDDSK